MSNTSVTLPSGQAPTLGQILPGRVPNWTEYGPGGACQGNATADTAAFQAAFAAGGRFTLKCSQPILLNDGAVATKWVHIEAENLAAPIKLTSAFPQSSDVVTLRPTATYDGSKYFGWRLAGLKIDPQVNGRGRHGIVIDLSAGNGVNLTGLQIEHNQVGDVVGFVDGFVTMGAAALRFIPHATQADQLYVSTIRENYFVGGPGVGGAPGGGIYMRRAGDSLHIDENWIKGYGRAIDIEFIPGAANPTFHRNNITAAGGAIRMRYGLRASILDNQIELLSTWLGDADRALLVVADSDGTVIDLNNVNADLGDHSSGLTADAISLLGTTTRTDIRSGNRLVVNGAAGRVHLRTASTVTATSFAHGQRIENPFLTIGTRTTPVLATSIGAAGSVRGLWFQAPLGGGWAAVSTGGATYEGLFYRIGTDGRVSLRGNLAPGTLTAGTIIASVAGDAIPARLMRLFPKQAQSGNSYLPLGVALAGDGTLSLTYAAPTNLPVSFDDTSYDPVAN